jgi:Haem-degrading
MESPAAMATAAAVRMVCKPAIRSMRRRPYEGKATDFGTPKDPLVGNRIGSVNVFGGGLPLYSKGRKIGAIGVSGDSSGTDQVVAWKVRASTPFATVPVFLAFAAESERRNRDQRVRPRTSALPQQPDTRVSRPGDHRQLGRAPECWGDLRPSRPPSFWLVRKGPQPFRAAAPGPPAAMHVYPVQAAGYKTGFVRNPEPQCALTPYDVRFIVTLNMVTHASFTCISLHASYDESLISVQRTR